MERIVVKIGTNVIVKNSNGLDHLFMDDIARQVADIKDFNREVIIVSSGAVASGMVIEPNLRTGRDAEQEEITNKQIAAMFGQPELMAAWKTAFLKRDIKVGEALLKDEDLDNFIHPLLKALKYGVVIVNGNDATYDPSTEAEIISRDNDTLSREIAFRSGAKILIMLTDAEGVWDRNKEVIAEIGSTNDLERVVFFEKTSNGKGGPESKLSEARSFITDSSKLAVIAGARIENVIVKIVQGERVGTRVTLPLQKFFDI